MTLKLVKDALNLVLSDLQLRLWLITEPDIWSPIQRETYRGYAQFKV